MHLPFSHQNLVPPLRRIVFSALVAIVVATASMATRADPSVPWTPTAIGRHQLELLVDDAGLDLTITHWPLPSAAVEHALDRLPAVLPAAQDAARAEVRRELQAQRRSRLSVTVRNNAEALSGFGDDATRGSSVGLRSSEFAGPLLAVQLGGRFDTSGGVRGGTQARLDDSAVATEVLGVQFQAFAHRSWWGPGRQSSLVLSNNAPAFKGVGLQRASASRSESPWLSWLGPWSFETFLAQTEDVTEPANPYLLAQRLTIHPFAALEIGFTRTAQWGGRGREQSARSFLDLLAGRGVNADTSAQRPNDPANELAGFDARLRCPFGLRCSLYAQGIGEDMAGYLPSRYLGLYGIDYHSADGRHRLFAEYAETGCATPVGQLALKGCAYRNYAYPQGYTSAGRWIGANVGPDSRLLTLGWLDAIGGTSLRLHYGNVGSRIGTFSALVDDPVSSGHLIGASLQQQFRWGPTTLTPALDYVRIRAVNGTRTDARVGVNLQTDLDAAWHATADGLGAALSGGGSSGGTGGAASAWRPVLVGGALVLGSTVLDRPLGDYARDHGNHTSTRDFVKFGDALPIAGIGLAGLSWALQHGSVQGDVAFAALEAGTSAYVASQAGKLLIDRARPSDGRGAASFGSVSRSQASFPSSHSAVAWAVVTPYAKYYDAPWLYGLAALTGTGRVLGNDHWVSDVVGGAAVGYFLGDYFYRNSPAAMDKSKVKFWITPRSVNMTMAFD